MALPPRTPWPARMSSPAVIAVSLRRGDPPGQARRGRGRQPRHRGDLLACRVGALAVQPGQEVLPGQNLDVSSPDKAAAVEH